MRRTVLLSIGIILSLLAPVSNANAKKLEPSLGPYMTDEGSIVKEKTFKWNEKPFAFLQFDIADPNLKWKWWYGNELISNSQASNQELMTSVGSSCFNFWNHLNNWDTIKRAGDWNIQAQWGSPGLGPVTNIVFTVIPEPVNSALFLIGGVVLALGYRWKVKRKQKV